MSHQRSPPPPPVSLQLTHWTVFENPTKSLEANFHRFQQKLICFVASGSLEGRGGKVGGKWGGRGRGAPGTL